MHPKYVCPTCKQVHDESYFLDQYSTSRPKRHADITVTERAARFNVKCTQTPPLTTDTTLIRYNNRGERLHYGRKRMEWAD